MQSERDTSVSKVHLGEIPPTYFDRTGHLGCWNLNKMYQDATTLSWLRFNFLNRGKLIAENNILFHAREKLIINPHFFRNYSKMPKSDIWVTYRLISTGRTSYIVRSTINDGVSSQEICQSDTVVVLIDAKTRRPRELPQWFKETYTNNESSTLGKKAETLTPPKNAFQASTLTRFSDMDWNYHVNAAEYFRFCADAAAEASVEGFFRHFKMDMSSYPLLEMDVVYMGEVNAGKTLNIHVWQDDTQDKKINFLISFKDRPIFQAAAIYDTVPYTILNKQVWKAKI